MSLADLLAVVRAEHGAGATRWLADQAGVDIRQAQRWYKGEGTPGKAAAARMGGIEAQLRRPLAAMRLRGVRRVSVGTIEVQSLSAGAPDGKRRPPVLDVGGIMGKVADAFAAGEDHKAQALFDSAVLNAYEGRGLEDQDGLASVLGISEYADGVTVVD